MPDYATFFQCSDSDDEITSTSILESISALNRAYQADYNDIDVNSSPPRKSSNPKAQTGDIITLYKSALALALGLRLLFTHGCLLGYQL